MMALSSAGFIMSEIMSDGGTPIPRQRFEFFLNKALELCLGVRALDERLISVVEKKEVEVFAALKARHTITIQEMMLGMKQT